MFGIRFMKGSPTTYVMHYHNGRVVREGPGRSFYYYAPAATVVAVPLSSVDVPFAFEEVTADFQAVTIQGQLTYRVADPKRVAGLLDFSIQPNGRYVSDDARKLDERLVNATQVLTSAVTHRMNLREVLVAHEALVAEVLAKLKAAEPVVMLGVEILALSVLAIRPAPETGKALEAEARENLQRQADEAIYARRNAAVAQERLIKESEMNTEIAVEEKKRQIRATRMSADIAVEQQRGELIGLQVANDRQEADSKAYALRAVVEPLRGLDWHTLMALSAGKADARTGIAMAFRDLADNAKKIGELNITPDLLSSLIDGGDGRDVPQAPPRKKP